MSASHDDSVPNRLTVAETHFRRRSEQESIMFSLKLQDNDFPDDAFLCGSFEKQEVGSFPREADRAFSDGNPFSIEESTMGGIKLQGKFQGRKYEAVAMTRVGTDIEDSDGRDSGGSFSGRYFEIGALDPSAGVGAGADGCHFPGI